MGCFGHLDKYTIVDLEEAKQLKDLAGLRRDFVDTTDSDDEVNFGFGGDVEVAG